MALALNHTLCVKAMYAYTGRLSAPAVALIVLRILVAQVDFMPVYSAHLREIIKKGVDHPEHYEQPLKGFKIIVDAGNGSGGFLASDVLAPLGADTSGVQYSDTAAPAGRRWKNVSALSRDCKSGEAADLRHF